MIATPLSQRSYFPMPLGSGRDTMLVDYTGSACTSRSGHTHAEQNQGVNCGWHKASNRAIHPEGPIQTLFMPDLQVYLLQAPAEPRFFEQRFDPERAILETILTFYRGLKLRVECFMNDESIFCQRIEVLECPEELKVDLGFALTRAHSACSALWLRWEEAFECQKASDRRHDFTYRCGEITGAGFMAADRDYDDTTEREGIYRAVKTGFCVSRFITCADSSETQDVQGLLDARIVADAGYDALKARHTAVWKAYFETSCVKLPDEEMQYLYNVSRYVVRTAQHPESGQIGLGMMPHLWRGGLYDVFDSLFAQRALLSCGNIREGRAYLQGYVDAAPAGREMLQKEGIAGTAFAGWDDYTGRFVRGEDKFVRYVAVYKPMMSAFVVHAAYWQYKYDPASLTGDTAQMIRDIIAFLMDVVVHTQGDKAWLCELEAGTEGGFMVDVDTFNQVVIGRAMEMAGEMLGDAEYARIGSVLLDVVAVNYTEDGVLMPYKGAEYTAGTPLLMYLYTLPDPIGIHSVDVTLERGRTHWGTNSEQPTEEYRHWPWNDSWAAICYTHDRQPGKAMDYLLHQKVGCTSLGAMPEKLRLDGYAIGYWYTSAHANLVWAVNDALSFSDREDELCLGMGFDERWEDVEVRGLVINEALTVSYRTEKRKPVRVEIENRSSETVSLRWIFRNAAEENAVIPAGETYIWKV